MILLRSLLGSLMLLAGLSLSVSACGVGEQNHSDGGADLEDVFDAGLDGGDSPCLPDPDGDDADAGPATDAGSDADAGLDEDAGLDGDAGIEEDAGPDGDAGIEEDAGPDGDAGIEEDAGPDGGLEEDAGLDADAGPDEDPQACPDDMVAAGLVCIDRHEASRSDATALHQGFATDAALSVEGVLPWVENPMTPEVLATFSAACAFVGKRLCTPQEWAQACHGPADGVYVFGNTFDREICNCVDTWCDDYCTAHPELDPCSVADNCGYTHGCMAIYPTGSMGACTNELGTFDINGNVWEIVAPSATDPRGYEVRGGAFNCAGAATRLQCDFNASWVGLNAGFRCCMNR